MFYTRGRVQLDIFLNKIYIESDIFNAYIFLIYSQTM